MLLVWGWVVTAEVIEGGVGELGEHVASDDGDSAVGVGEQEQGIARADPEHVAGILGDDDLAGSGLDSDLEKELKEADLDGDF